MRLKSILLIIIVLCTLSIQAQSWNQRRYEFYYGIGMSNFMGDIAAPTDASKNIWMHFFNTMGPVVNTGLRYHLQDRHYARASLFLGQFFAEDPLNDPNYYYRGYKMSSFFTELSVKYEFLILKEKSRRNVYRQLGESKLKNFSLPTYVFIGFGGTFNVGNLQDVSGKEATKESFSNIAPIVPIGFGMKFRASRYTYLNIEAGIRITFSDGIDNAVGTPENHFGEYWDQYQFLTFNVIHKLKTNKKGLPKFRKK